MDLPEALNFRQPYPDTRDGASCLTFGAQMKERAQNARGYGSPGAPPARIRCVVRLAPGWLASLIAIVGIASWSSPAVGGQKRPDQSKAVPESQSIFTPPAPSQSVEIGEFYLRRKDYRGAVSRFQEALHSDPDYAPAYLGLGRVYEKTGEPEKALQSYQKYLDLLPSDKDAEQAKGVRRAMERLRRQGTPSG